VARLDQLDKGINIGGWLALGKSYDPSNVQTFITERDIQQIKNLGFDHIRLPVNPIYLLDESNPSKLKTEYLGYLDRALDMIMSQGLAVVVDLHGGTPFKSRLAKDDGFVDTVAQFWQSLAQHLSPRNPDRVFLEVLNEPNFQDLLGSKSAGITRWASVEQKLVAAIRQGAPTHTIIATSSDLDSITGLKQGQILSDRNVIYAFHFYDPILFTHQGAKWIPGFDDFSNVPYPFDSRTSRQAQVASPQAGDKLTNYYSEQWNVGKLEAEIASIATWAKSNGVTVIANEFGVYKTDASASDRAVWLHDVRSLLEKYDIGWTMWDYAGGFGLTSGRQGGDRKVDSGVAGALGLI
jgi:endoglucanase